MDRLIKFKKGKTDHLVAYGGVFAASRMRGAISHTAAACTVAKAEESPGSRWGRLGALSRETERSRKSVNLFFFF